MPSIEESKKQVKVALAGQPTAIDIDHDAILASLQDEIDRHNESRGSSSARRYSPGQESTARKDLKFRFKSGTPEPKKRKSHSKHAKEKRKHRKRKEQVSGSSPEQQEPAAHPFPREPTDPDETKHSNPNVAFRDSLFDALADDEGAAYWENVYSQPIHVYTRPVVETAKGKMEEMNDDDYAAYVQTRMWEKKHPHVVRERQRKEKQRREDEEERARRREEFVRKKERAAWEDAQKAGARKFAGVESDAKLEYEYVFDAADVVDRSKGYREAWERYLSAWDTLKRELLKSQPSDPASAAAVSKRIPWPVISPKPVIKPNIEDFLRHMPVSDDGGSKLQLLKAERVRWHPDKIQQRFGGEVDEGTMKLVTGVFQIIGALLEQEHAAAN